MRHAACTSSNVSIEGEPPTQKRLLHEILTFLSAAMVPGAAIGVAHGCVGTCNVPVAPAAVETRADKVAALGLFALVVVARGAGGALDQGVSLPTHE